MKMLQVNSLQCLSNRLHHLTSFRKVPKCLLMWFVASGFNFIIVWKRLFRVCGKPQNWGISFCRICKHPEFSCLINSASNVFSCSCECAMLPLQALDASPELDENTRSLLKDSLSTYAVALLTKLRCVDTGDVVTVANIHVVWDNFERPDRQCLQVTWMSWY